MSFAVCVTLQVDPSKWDEFLPLLKTNASSALRDEPGCQQFDVLSDPDRPHELFLYEKYDDLAAFEAHLASDHYKTFDSSITRMVRSRKVRTYSVEHR